MLKRIFYPVILIVFGLFIVSCEKEVEPIEAKTTDILTDANPQTGKYTYLALKQVLLLQIPRFRQPIGISV